LPISSKKKGKEDQGRGVGKPMTDTRMATIPSQEGAMIMFRLKWSRFGAAVILAALGVQNLAWGQPQNSPPMANNGTSATPQFRPLTAADVQDALAQVKVAAAALDQRFGTAGTSADGWKAYLSWNPFNSELQKAKPDNAVLGDAYKKLAAGYEGLELKWFADLRTALA
jgi:hypothetical protein